MPLFSRKRRDDSNTPDAPAGAEPSSSEELDEPVESTSSARLTAAQRAEIEALVAAVSAEIDVDDLQAISAAYDQALADFMANGGDRDAVVRQVGIAIGEHLVRHGKYDWAQITDSFGTDIGVVARRREIPVVPHNLVGARWIMRQSGWIPGVVGHLVNLGTA